MSARRGQRDVVVVGAGVVGAASALALAKLGLDVALVEGREPVRWSQSHPDLRVYAFAPDNAQLLDALGAWKSVSEARAQAYRRMRVWDAAGGGELKFDADAFGRAQLGWIVENNLLVEKLWDALVPAGVQVHCPARVVDLEQDDAGVRVRLDDGTKLDARIAIAADGARSTLRQLAGIDVFAKDYAQSGVVAFIESEKSHEDTAWQRFLSTGPLALLPFADGKSSIVWTLPEAEAQRVLHLDDAAFSRELGSASGGARGELRVASKRAAFPLLRQNAETYLRGRVLLLGDAAHVVHPLAGQGVNLGLRDVAALRASILDAQQQRADWASPQRLQRWARARRSEDALGGLAFSGINALFSNGEMHLTLLRGPLLGLAGKLPPLSDFLWRKASGI